MAVPVDDLETAYAVPAAPKRRRTRQPGAVWLALLVGLFAMAGNVFFLNRATKVEPVAVAARDLAAGETVTPGDFRLIEMSTPSELAGRVYGVREVNDPAPKVTTHSITAGALMQRGDLAEAGAPGAQRAMSVPVDPTEAVGGSLRVGDLVDVIDASGAEAVYVLTAARVLAVADAGGGRLGGGSSKFSVTVAVDAASALRVAAAIEGGKHSVVRSTGAPAALVSPPTTAVRR